MKYIPYITATVISLAGLVVLTFLIWYSFQGAGDFAQDNRRDMKRMEVAVNSARTFIKKHGRLPMQQDIDSGFTNEHFEFYSTVPSNYPFAPWPDQTLNYAIGIWNGDNMEYFDSFSDHYTYQASDSASKVILGLWPGFSIGLFLALIPWSLLFFLKQQRSTEQGAAANP